MSRGVLLINLGSPDSPSVPDVRRYLREFLMDPRVIDISYPARFFVVHGCILPFRPKQSAHAYQTIWGPEGSPLVNSSLKACALLRSRLGIPVELCMRYQKPSVRPALEKLAASGVTDLFLIPLFPHYAMSSFETAVEHVGAALKKWAPQMRMKVQPPFYAHPAFIDALVGRAQPYLDQPYDHLLFSYHGIPERQVRKSDPTGRHCLSRPDCCDAAPPGVDPAKNPHATCYRHQCFATTKAFAARANLSPDKYSNAFQSRLGRDPWLRPYTDFVLEELPQRGVKRLLVICPAFVSDCLETIEEIGMRGRDSFLKAGGEAFDLIPCLNEHPLWINALESFCRI